MVNCYIPNQSLFYRGGGGEHICWILDLEGEVHLIYNLCTSILQESKGNVFFGSLVGRTTLFGRDQKNFKYDGVVAWQSEAHAI